MPRKVFTAGEVLAAADVNSFLMDQTVMSFAGTAARGSAIPSPVTGMTTYLEDTKDLQIYDGSAYNSALGLVLIKKQTIGTAVTSITVNNAFSSDFDDYKILVTGGTASTAGNLTLQIGAAATGYNSSLAYVTYSNALQTIVAENNAALWGNAGAFTSSSKSMDLDVISPNLSAATRIMGFYVGASIGGPVVGFLNNTNSYTGFTVGVNTGNLTGGAIYVYGYRKN